MLNIVCTQKMEGFGLKSKFGRNQSDFVLLILQDLPVLKGWTKSCVLHITYQIKMLIRHISIPRHSYLVPLPEPKPTPQLEQSSDYAVYFTQTLHPEQPISNILTSEKQGLLSQSGKEMNDHSFSRESHLKHLSKQSPQKMDEIQDDFFFSPKKQNYKNRPWEFENPEQNLKVNQLKNRFPTFSTYVPQLRNNAYLNQNNEANQANFSPNPHNINNFCYLQSNVDQSQEVIISNKHLNRISKNREVYRTLQKFKSKGRSDEADSPGLKNAKKYSYNPPKQQFAYPQSQVNQPLQRQASRKQTKLQPLSSKSVKPYISNPVLPEKIKKIMPEEQEDQSQAIIFHKQKRKSMSLRKTSEQEMSPAPTPKSEIHLSNKKMKQRSPVKRTVQEVESKDIEISYRTSLVKVREICSLNSLQNYNLIVKIPEIFAYPLFSGNQSQEELFNKADEALKNLQIARKDISLKKYSNCVVILSGSIGVIWHYNGKVYFGGWKHHILDEGVKHGLGLEWVPKKYVFYGEFNKNKREGVGIMKTNDDQILAGIWRENHFIKSLGFQAEESGRPKYKKNPSNY